MPIRPENKNRYPKNWKEIVARIRERAGDKCEICGVLNHVYIKRLEGNDYDIMLDSQAGEPGVVRVVCTTMHLDHTPENCDPANLKFACQKCHNSYDAKHRAAGIKERRFKDQIELPL